MTAAEIAALKLPGLPGDKSAVIRRTDREGWKRQKRKGRGGGFEYHVSNLPGAAQKALVSRALAAPAKPAALPVIKNARELKAFQREALEARATLLAEIDRLVVGGLGRSKAIETMAEMAKARQLAPELQKLVALANARGGAGGERTLTRATLYNWLKAREQAGGDLAALAPTAPQEAPAPTWAGTLMRLYARPTKPGLVETLEAWPEGEAKPSYDQARRFLKRLDAVTRNTGRMGPRALKQLKAYVARDVSELWPGAVFIGDGHTFKREVAHPLHGKAFRPEVTAILDVYTRRWVGWSAALAENTWSVADALRHAVCTTTCCDIFYYDNGAGANNATWDDALTGLAARLGITKFNSAPWTSQSRGVIERFNSSVLHRLARKAPTYIGERMDDEARKRAFKITRAEIKETGTSRLLTPWKDFLGELDAEVTAYNRRPHETLPKIIDPETGKRRHMCPDEAWARAMAEGWQPDAISAADAVDLFRPAETRKVNRGIVQIIGNEYFAAELERLHGEEVIVAYDIHDAGKVWVRLLDGRFVCEAIFEGNKRSYLPVSFVEQAHAKRVAGRLARNDARRDDILDELRPVALIEQPAAPATEAVSAENEARAEALLARFEPAPKVVALPPTGDRPWFDDEEHRLTWLAECPERVTPADLAWVAEKRRASRIFVGEYAHLISRIEATQEANAAGSGTPDGASIATD